MLESKKVGKKPGMIYGVSVLLILVLASSAGAATNISECGNITTGGYVLNKSLSNSSTCITVDQNDVVIDGAGYSISGSLADNTYGVYVKDHTNVTVKNLTVTGYFNGILFLNASNGNMTNITAINNTYALVLYTNSNNNNGLRPISRQSVKLLYLKLTPFQN
jgi:hypothetical protein